MKQLSTIICTFLLTLCTFSLPVLGEIIETEEIKTVIPYINQHSVFFFNVTGTLYAPSNVLADRRWRDYFSDRVKDIVKDHEAGQQLIDKVKNQIVNNIPKKSIEEMTPRLIDLLQEKKIIVLGITQKQMSTSYADNFGEITRNHLLSLGINLEKTLNYFQLPKDIGEKSDFTFAYGLLFTNKEPVGSSIVSFLKQSGLLKADKTASVNVVIVDNSQNTLESAQEALDEAGIPFAGIRYGRADAKEKFDPTLGTVEFFAFINEGKILSDAEALQAIPADRSVNYETMLDKYIEHAASLETNSTK